MSRSMQAATIKLFAHAGLFLRAAKMGVLWPGTTRFRLPKRFRFNSRSFSISGPNEESLGWVFRDLLLNDEYGLESLPIVPETILDVGGNIGLFTLWAGACFPEALIHVYEPNPALLGYLESNVVQVSATVFAAGVSAEDGRGTFAENSMSMVGQCSIEQAGEITISSLRTAIDRLGGSVDLLKLDCEGAEWEIFADLESFKHVKVLRIEYHLTRSDRSLGWMIDQLEHVGLRLARLSVNQGFGIAWFNR